MIQRLRSFEALVVLSSVVALLIVGPLRDLFGTVPLVPFLATLFLFVVPGALLSRWFFGEQFPGAALIPVSFALSAGMFGLLGVPMLMLGESLETYLLFSGAVLAASLMAGAFVALLRSPPPKNDSSSGASTGWLWAPFLFLGAALTFASRLRSPNLYEDAWVYLAYAREFLNSDRLARYEPYFGNETGLSRLKINGWMLEQAALSRVSGIDPVELVLWYLNPALVIVGLLAFHALARILFKSEKAALLAGCLYALFFLTHLHFSLLSLGGEFITRLVEDKGAARFIFLPAALCMAVLFVESRKLRYLAAFTFLYWSSLTIHPVGLAIIGLSTAGFCLLYLAVNWRERGAWATTAALGAAGLSVILLPASLVVATGVPFADLLKAADINAGNPDVLSNMVFARPDREQILELSDGLYIMHPSLLLDPVILAAFVLGIPFLLWRLKSSLAAQLLLGTLLLTTIVCYVPQIATFMANNVVVPGQLHRLAWPIPLAAALSVCWMVREATRYAQAGLDESGAARLAGLAPVLLVAALTVVAAPVGVAGMRVIYQVSRSQPVGAPVGEPTEAATGFDPIFPWMRDNIREPSIVLAPDAVNTVIPAWSANANVVSLRGGLVIRVLPSLERHAGERIEVPQGAMDVQTFFSGPSLEEGIRILRRYNVDYVMVHADSPLDEQLAHLTGFTPTDSPKDRYGLYAVDLRKLGG